MAVAHGSRDPRASATVEALLEQVRRARPGLAVHAAYLDHSRPSLREALAPLDEAVVLPLLLTEAYHSRVDIPAALREERASRTPLPAGHGRSGEDRTPLRVQQGAALGPHPLLITALERRLAEAGVEIGDPDTAVVLVSAGSSDRRANAVIAGMARDWARVRGWWSVTAAYASAASPTPKDAVLALLDGGTGPHGTGPGAAGVSGRRRAPRVVVAPYLLASGHFAGRVGKSTLEAGALAVADPLGPAPELVTVLLERYEQAVRAFRAGAPASADA
ncbi:sirohydrochlorin chelatase [Sphaerisporangium perillae]|uniref:sirohydrochlorin chelatase n=1 Tax=Sphaerisporangium perillae TaxID=2935860 RepID=UPI00200DB02B|nr:sirohydrochlorin chelatase [Sphaerisporangium perillae]